MIKYISKETASLYSEADPHKKLIELLWGDQFRYENEPANGYYSGLARGVKGLVKAADLGDKSLLEIYFIDVGQGDGILIRTPANRHILVDGGYKRSAQPSGKNAADFVDWKFKKDYGKDQIILDAMISSHADADHYGGLWDLINPAESRELDISTVKVNAYYHPGVSWWKNQAGVRSIGEVKQDLIITILEDNAAVTETLQPNAPWRLQGEWGKFIYLLNEQHVPIKRLFHQNGQPLTSLEGFNKTQILEYARDADLDIKVLGPVELRKDNLSGYQDFGSDSLNTNGHSVTLRVDYGKFRLLLTGDLNAGSQRLLLESHEGNRLDFQTDVVKSCHHGSDDVSLEFLQHVNAAATVISSGDSEGHDHPRPTIVAASALTGFQQVKDDKLVTPMVYSTEIARSYKLGRPYQVDITNGTKTSYTDMKEITVSVKETSAGALKPKKKTRKLDHAYVVSGIVYGLVNVRTDGSKILCATLNEDEYKWQVKTFKSRF